MKKNSHFDPFLGKDSAEVSAEASVKMTEASVSAESHFRPIRSFTSYVTQLISWNEFVARDDVAC